MRKLLVSLSALSALMLATRLASADDASSEPKNPATAFALSAGGAVASVGLAVLGAKLDSGTLAVTGALGSLVAPAAGEFYAGQLFTPGMALRVVSGVTMLVGFGRILGCGLFEGESDDEGAHSSCSQGSGKTVLVIGAIGYAGGILYDIVTAGRAVDDYNQQLHVRIAPTVIQTASSGPAVGLGIGGSF